MALGEAKRYVRLPTTSTRFHLIDDCGSASPAGWKPVTMRAPVLCTVVVISLSLAGVLEYLAQKSQRQGGLALSSSEDDISKSVNIAYLYMPTTVAVMYSLLWTWVDLDVRRMQPWLELSRSHGAKAEQSLLLNYPFEFLAFVPIKAWKQRHWPVFITGSIMMLIFWAITPLQGAIFGQQAVTVSRNRAMTPSSGLMAVEEQAALIDVSILNSAYGTTCKLTFNSFLVFSFSILSNFIHPHPFLLRKGSLMLGETF